jgi:hypothetical protein
VVRVDPGVGDIVGDAPARFGGIVERLVERQTVLVDPVVTPVRRVALSVLHGDPLHLFDRDHRRFGGEPAGLGLGHRHREAVLHLAVAVPEPATELGGQPGRLVGERDVVRERDDVATGHAPELSAYRLGPRGSACAGAPNAGEPATSSRETGSRETGSREMAAGRRGMDGSRSGRHKKRHHRRLGRRGCRWSYGCDGVAC